MKKELWDNIKAVNAGKLVVSREQELEMMSKGYEMLIEDSFDIGKLNGKAEIFMGAGKVLIGAGTIWYLFGKLTGAAAKQMAEQYNLD